MNALNRFSKISIKNINSNPCPLGFLQRFRFSTMESGSNNNDNSQAKVNLEEGTKPTESSKMESKDQVDLKAKDRQIAELKDAYLRAMAESENTRQRAKAQVEQTAQFAIQKFAKDLLDTADVLQLALDSVNQDDLKDQVNPPLKNLHVGVSMTRNELMKTFKKHGIESFNPIDQKFDPNLHQALFQNVIPDKEPGTIFHVQKIGFSLNGRVIRAAQVGVVKSKE